MVRLEGGRDHLEQALGRDAVDGVDVPVVDGAGVAGGLPHDVAVQAAVAARDALGLHDAQRLADPAVQVVGVRLRGDRLHRQALRGATGGGRGRALLRGLLGGGVDGGLLDGGRLGGGSVGCLLLCREGVELDVLGGELVRHRALDVLQDGAGGDLRGRGGGTGRDGVGAARSGREGEGGGAERGYTGDGDLVVLGQLTTVGTVEDVLGHG